MPWRAPTGKHPSVPDSGCHNCEEPSNPVGEPSIGLAMTLAEPELAGVDEGVPQHSAKGTEQSLRMGKPLMPLEWVVQGRWELRFGGFDLGCEMKVGGRLPTGKGRLG